jgi:hypothetical protein
VNSIYIPSRPDKCTDDLLFQYGEDFSAYLSPEGNIKATSNESQCEIGFKRIKYALKRVMLHPPSEIIYWCYKQKNTNNI